MLADDGVVSDGREEEKRKQPLKFNSDKPE
jgi:hypothetical protein